MYYEFYIDLYFLENLVMNYLILRMAGQIAGRRGCLRLALPSIFGAVCACLIAVAPIHRNAFLSVILSFLYGIAMAAAGYGVHGWEEFTRMTTVFFLSALLLGGIWQLLLRYLPMDFFTAIPAGYLIMRVLVSLWQKRRGRTQYLYEVTIVRGGKTATLTGLLDSGNQLVMPGCKKPVQVVDFDVIRDLLTEEETEELECMMRLEASAAPSGKFTYIPYHSIGREHGLLPVMMLDHVLIKHGESVWDTKQAAAAISRTAVSGGGEYQMILHPQVLK